MQCVTVHSHGGWFGYVLNNRRRVVFSTGAFPTEPAARRAANLFMLKQRGA